MTIESLVTRPVSTVCSKATCVEAARRMKHQNIRSVVVEEDGVPTGILTERDLTVRLLAEELDASTVTVDKIMSAFPAVLTLHHDLRGARDVMVQMGVRRLPAVNAKGRVIGIVSLDDILIELARGLGQVPKLLLGEQRAHDVDDQMP